MGWAELNNCSGIHIESIIINVHSISDIYLKLCQVNRRISNNIEITLSCHHQLEKIGDSFLPDSNCHVKQSNHILQAFLDLSFLYARDRIVSLFLLSLLVSKTEENFPTWDLNIIFWTLLINWVYHMFYRTGLPHVFIWQVLLTAEVVLLITND